MSKKSSYRIAFEFLEGQMFGVGLDQAQTIKALEGGIGPEDMKYSLVTYSKRFDWNNRVIEALREIYNDVDLNTKNIIGLLYMQGESFDYVSKELNIGKKRLIRQHAIITDEAMDLLGMEVDRKTKGEKSDRVIPSNVKREVFKRDRGKCMACESDSELHYHHIKRFADGGTHSVYNLVLLCVGCHATEHEGEQAYHMLRKMAERVRV